jgi:CHASE3 domain sensor protein
VDSKPVPDPYGWTLSPFKLLRSNRNLQLCSLAVVLLFCVQAVAVVGTMRVIARYQDATHIQTFLVHLNNVMFLASGAVAGQRGYETTGDGTYLGRYREAVGRVDAELKALQSAGAGFPVRARYLGLLERDTRSRRADSAPKTPAPRRWRRTTVGRS